VLLALAAGSVTVFQGRCCENGCTTAHPFRIDWQAFWVAGLCFLPSGLTHTFSAPFA